jgi:hypothetical protein
VGTVSGLVEELVALFDKVTTNTPTVRPEISKAMKMQENTTIFRFFLALKYAVQLNFFLDVFGTL